MLRSVPASGYELTLASWWGYAEADRLLLGVVVAVLVALALTYTAVQVNRRRRARRPARPRPGHRRV